MQLLFHNFFKKQPTGIHLTINIHMKGQLNRHFFFLSVSYEIRLNLYCFRLVRGNKTIFIFWISHYSEKRKLINQKQHQNLRSCFVKLPHSHIKFLQTLAQRICDTAKHYLCCSWHTVLYNYKANSKWWSSWLWFLFYQTTGHDFKMWDPLWMFNKQSSWVFMLLLVY